MLIPLLQVLIQILPVAVANALVVLDHLMLQQHKMQIEPVMPVTQMLKWK